MDGEEEIRRLKRVLKECQQSLLKITAELKRSKGGDNSHELRAKERELQDLQTKLANCQSEKESLQQELAKKIAILKNSQLSNEEKAQKITDLLVGYKTELDLFNQELAHTWISCASQREQIIHYLAQPCQVCKHQFQTVTDLTKVRNWLIGAVSLLLLLLYRSWQPKKSNRNKKNNYDNLTRISK